MVYAIEMLNPSLLDDSMCPIYKAHHYKAVAMRMDYQQRCDFCSAFGNICYIKLIIETNPITKTGDMNPILSMSHRLIKVFNKSATFCDSALMGQINFTQKPFFV